MEFRPATREDLLQFMDAVPFSARAYAAVQDGVVYGVGGIYYLNGNAIAFTHNRADMPKRDRIRGGRILIDLFKKVIGPVYAIPGPIETAEATLRHFGFEPIDDGKFYIWAIKNAG